MQEERNMTTATKFAPTVREDCGDVFWAHPAFEASYGEITHYTVSVNGGEREPYTPGTEIQVAEDGAPWQVTLHAYSKTFPKGHQIGQHKGQAEVCVGIPEKPEPLVRNEKQVVADPVCAEEGGGVVTTTTYEESAGYWYDETSNEWILGDWFETGETFVDERNATPEECPAPAIEEEEKPTEEQPDTPVEHWSGSFLDCENNVEVFWFLQQREGYEDEYYEEAEATDACPSSPSKPTISQAVATDAQPAQDELAATGMDLGSGVALSGLLIAAVGTWALISAAVKGRAS